MPAPLWNSRQAMNTTATGLEALRRPPGHHPKQPLVVWFVTGAGTVLAHALGNKFLPVLQLVVADLSTRRAAVTSEP